MAKRFIDTGLFDDPFIATISSGAKFLYIYYITKCDSAGLLKLNEPLWLFQTGLKSLDTPLKELETRILRLNDDLFFCPKFIKFQYPDWPDSKFRAATSAMDRLTKLGIDLNSLEGLSKDLPKSYGNGNGKDNKRSGKSFVPDFEVLPESFRDIYRKWWDYRVKLKKPFIEVGWGAFVKSVENEYKTPEAFDSAVMYTMSKQWQGLQSDPKFKEATSMYKTLENPYNK